MTLNGQAYPCSVGFDWLGWGGVDLFESHAESTSTHEGLGCTINPATGLMIGGCGDVDVAGSPFGTDLDAGDRFVHGR
jgi:hypothetical protein